MRLVLMSLFILIGYLHGNPSLTYLDDMQDENLYLENDDLKPNIIKLKD